MLRMARLHVPTDSVAEEVVQETWLAVLTGLTTLPRRVVVAHLGLPHPAQPGEDARGARTPDRAVRQPDRRRDDGSDRRPTGSRSRRPAPRGWRRFPEEWPEQSRSRASCTRSCPGPWTTLPPRQRVVVRCATSTASRPTRSAPCWRSARATSGCCSTGAAPSYEPTWSATTTALASWVSGLRPLPGPAPHHDRRSAPAARGVQLVPGAPQPAPRCLRQLPPQPP